MIEALQAVDELIERARASPALSSESRCVPFQNAAEINHVSDLAVVERPQHETTATDRLSEPFILKLSQRQPQWRARNPEPRSKPLLPETISASKLPFSDQALQPECGRNSLGT